VLVCIPGLNVLKLLQQLREDRIFVHSLCLLAGNIWLQKRCRPDRAAVNFSCLLPLLYLHGTHFAFEFITGSLLKRR
jgi:hypothetical protein